MNIESVTWKRGVPTRGVDAVAAHKTLEKIRDKNGNLTDDAILAAAKSVKSVIHNWFEWDDTVAAEHHRRLQARKLMTSLEITYQESPETTVRAYQVFKSAPVASDTRSVYSTTEEVLRDPEARDRLIADAIRAAMEFRRRFKVLHELEAVIQAIDATIETLTNAECS